MGVQEYRVKGFVSAERIAEDGVVFTNQGAVWGNEGDYLVHSETGTTRWDGNVFEDFYEPVPAAVTAARNFTPDGKTVEEVLNFLKENPDEVQRVKDLETAGGGRKGITEYEIR